MQPKIEDRLGLGSRQAVPGIFQSKFFRLVLGPCGVGASALQQRHDLPRRPDAAHQSLARFGRRGGLPDQRDHLVDVGQRHRLPFQHVSPVPGLAKLVEGTPRDDLPPVAEKCLEQALEVQQPRLAVQEGNHVDAEDALELSVLEEVVQHHVGNLAPPQLDHHAQTVLVGLVAQLGDAFQALLPYQFGDLLDQPRLVDLVGQFGDDDGFPAPGVQRLGVRACADIDLAAAGLVGIEHSLNAIDQAGGGKIGSRNQLDQLGDPQVRVVQQRQAGIDDLAQVMGRDIGGHADRDARRTVDQQLRQARRQDGRFVLGFVVVGDEIHCLHVDVGQQFLRDPGHADLGVTHRRGGIAVDGAEVALPVH